ncbi:MAG TPA: hypothetical protein VIY49_03040 [Bryobacteraceae bacterium]
MQKGLPFKSHPSDDAPEEYALNPSSAEQWVPLEEHLLACTTCQHALAEIDEYVLLMKLAPHPP